MRFSYLIIDDNETAIRGTLDIFESFPNYFCVGVVKDSQNAINEIVKVKPQLVFFRLPIKSDQNNFSLSTIAELFQYIETMPYCVMLADTPDSALEAIQSGCSDYIVGKLHMHILGKCLFRFEKRNPAQVTSSMCIKSYSDYQFVNLQDIIYLKADNNTTDIKLVSNNVVNAYKTLKHFESTLPFYFLRIHKSYIVNINHVSRIHFSKNKMLSELQ